MSSRRVRVVLLCEDNQHETFVRRFLSAMGWNTRELYVVKSPSASGAAEQFVRERFPDELAAYHQRKNSAASALIAIIDADSKTVYERKGELEDASRQNSVPFRSADDAVALLVPKRNIETWIKYLMEGEAEEDKAYPKLQRQRECREAVEKLVELCRQKNQPEGKVMSLADACNEYSTRIAPLRKEL